MNFRAMSLCCRLLVAAVLLLACFYKIIYPYDFARVVSKYALLPDAAVNVFALALPWIELVLAIALLFSRSFREAAAWGSIVLLLMFIVAISIKLFQGAEIHCGCFSSAAASGSTIGPANLFRNIGLVILCAFAIYVERAHPAKSN
jgi:uncharacterized membrane protein